MKAISAFALSHVGIVSSHLEAPIRHVAVRAATLGAAKHARSAPINGRSIASAAAAARVAASAARASGAARASTASRVAARSTSAGRARTAGGDRTSGSRVRHVRMKRAEVSHQQVETDRANFGDLSRTYRFPGFAAVDQLSVNMPKAIAKHSPYLARVLTDASYLRAALGPLALLLPLAAIVAGVAAGHDTTTLPIPTSPTMFAIVAVLGILDAAAGLAATAAFLAFAATNDEIHSLITVAVAVVVATTWAGIPIMVGKLRSFTREHPEDAVAWWTRLGDMILGSFFAAFITASLLGIVGAASSVTSPILLDATAIGWIVGAAALLRYIASSFVAFAYPLRLTEIHVADLPSRSAPMEVASVLVRASAAMLLFAAFLGWRWIVFVMAALYGADALVQYALRERSYHLEWSKLIPNNISKLLVITVLSVLSANLLRSYVHSTYWQIAADLTAVLLLALVFDALSAPSGASFRSTWATRLGGAAIATVTMAQLLGLLVT